MTHTDFVGEDRNVKRLDFVACRTFGGKFMKKNMQKSK